MEITKITGIILNVLEPDNNKFPKIIKSKYGDIKVKGTHTCAPCLFSIGVNLFRLDINFDSNNLTLGFSQPIDVLGIPDDKLEEYIELVLEESLDKIKSSSSYIKDGSEVTL